MKYEVIYIMGGMKHTATFEHLSDAKELYNTLLNSGIVVLANPIYDEVK